MEQISDVMQALTGQLAQWGILEDANLSNITEKFGNQIVSAISGLADGGSKVAFSAVSGLTKQVPMVMIGLFVCLISSYFFVAEKNENEAFLKQVIPESIQKNFKVLTGSSKKAVGGYIRAQVKIELWIYLVLVIGLFILRVDYVLVVSFIIAFLDFLPILGAGIVMIPVGSDRVSLCGLPESSGTFDRLGSNAAAASGDPAEICRRIDWHKTASDADPALFWILHCRYGRTDPCHSGRICFVKSLSGWLV